MSKLHNLLLLVTAVTLFAQSYFWVFPDLTPSGWITVALVVFPALAIFLFGIFVANFFKKTDVAPAPRPELYSLFVGLPEEPVSIDAVSVVAFSESQARSLASKMDEGGGDIWLDHDETMCFKQRLDKPYVVLGAKRLNDRFIPF